MEGEWGDHVRWAAVYTITSRLANYATFYAIIRFDLLSQGAFNDPFELVPRMLIPKGTVPQGRRNYQFSLNTPRRPIDIDRKYDRR